MNKKIDGELRIFFVVGISSANLLMKKIEIWLLNLFDCFTDCFQLVKTNYESVQKDLWPVRFFFSFEQLKKTQNQNKYSNLDI